LLQQALWKNYSDYKKTDLDLVDLSESEVELRAINMEYQIFSSVKVASIYRRNMTQLTSQIKKKTEELQLYPKLLEPNLPTASASESEELLSARSNSGFIKASELVSASSASVEPSVKVETLEEDSPIKGVSLLVKKRVSRFVPDGSQDVPASSVNPNSTKLDESNNSSDLILKAKQIEERLSSMLNLKSKTAASLNKEAAAAAAATNKVVKVKSSSSSSQSNTKDSKPKPSSRATTSIKSAKRSLENQTTLDRFIKKQRIDPTEAEHKSSQSTAVKTDSGTLKTSSSHSGDKKRTFLPTTSPEKKKTASPQKQATADMVIHCLMPHYKAGQIAGKELFKSLARHLSHLIRDSSTSPSRKHCTILSQLLNLIFQLRPFTEEADVKEFIEAFFMKKGGKIKSEEDLK